MPQLLGIAVVNTDNYAQHRISDPQAARDGSIPTGIARQVQHTVRHVGTSLSADIMNDRVLRCLPASLRRATNGTRRHRKQAIALRTAGKSAISTFALPGSFAYSFKYGRSKPRVKVERVHTGTSRISMPRTNVLIVGRASANGCES
ncbi:hypothetical protein [Paraburkholderia sp. ZP32-5]|uniref:hypothetical protein n=1 Tax=Paraburkholderia sp. ZP32-5 TaxID=2883245 RepID=UPI001F381F32|nr:hypothetical protein [Paraburkholderia sp. ZP32-5]